MANRIPAFVKGPNPARVILTATGLAPKMMHNRTIAAVVTNENSFLEDMDATFFKFIAHSS